MYATLEPDTHFCAVYLQQEEQVCSLAPPLEEALLEWACRPLGKQDKILMDERDMN